MKSKKILCVLHLPPPVHGAAMVGNWIKDSELINKDLDITYVNLSTSQTLQEIGEGGIKKLLSFFKVFFRVFKSIFGKKYDLCYMTLTATGAGFYKDACVVFLLKLFGQNIIYHFHNKGVSKNSDSSMNQKLYKFVFKNTKSILLSKHLYNDIAEFVSEKDVYYCPNGINNVDFDFNSIKNTNVNDPCKFLWLSNMMEEKGVLVLLEACKLLKSRNIAFECHFIGAWSDVTEEKFNQKVVEFGIKENIFAHGKKYNEDKFEFFKNSDVFVFPTYYHNETFGLVLVEAMQAYLPAVSTNEGGIPDVVENGKTGLIVEKRNSKDLADKLELLCLEPELRIKMGKAGNQRYKEKFTMDIFENKIQDIFQEA